MGVTTSIAAGQSYVTLPYFPSPAKSIEVYTTAGLKLPVTGVSGNTVVLTSGVTALTNVIVGYPYTMKYTFSEQVFKAKAGSGKSPSNATKMLIRNGSLYFDDTAYFCVKVTPKNRSTTENVYTPNVADNYTNGFYRFPVCADAKDATITIENSTALPSTFQSAEFESFVHPRSSRYG